MTDRSIDTRVPDNPPDLSPAGWRTLLDVLTDDAERRWGSAWRGRLFDREHQ